MSKKVRKIRDISDHNNEDNGIYDNKKNVASRNQYFGNFAEKGKHAQ
jgi:hypothetical protein